MCGIAGYWSYAAAGLPDALFRAFTNSMAHRGPDGVGVENFPSERLWLGHRRLAILDVSERGRQPMAYANGRFWLTYNGEIYNFLELRETLRGLGHSFTTDTDSEVLLAAYAEWGPNCQTRFNGMWAFAIWDERRRELFLSRDRFGIKPFHYRLGNGTFSFASELKAFLTLPEVDGRLDERVMAETLLNINGQESTPHTLLPGVHRLPGGHCMTLGADGNARIEQWWDTLAQLPSAPDSVDRQVSEFRELFLDSCRLRLRSDVPVATALSGGLDSSAVACSIAELGRGRTIEHAPRDWQRAFIACFPGTRLDEREYAQVVVDHTQLAANFHDIDDHVALRSLEKVVFDLEGIYWVPLVGPWGIYRAMRDGGIRVSLDGHGADELLGGYHFFVERALNALIEGKFSLGRYLDLKRVLRGLVGGSGDVTRAGVASDLRFLAERELARLGFSAPARRAYNQAKALYSRLRHPRLTAAVTDDTQPPPVEPALRNYPGPWRLYDESADPRTAGMSGLDAMLFTWFHGSVLPTILRSYDRASMAHGIEVRMPFMDWRLVTYGFALPESTKIGGGYTKRILREAMVGLMPDAIRLRSNKIGFTSPMDEWSRGALKDWLRDTCNSAAFLDSSVWNGPAVRQLVERAVVGQGSVNPIWPIINAHVLQQQFAAAAQTAAPPLESEFHVG